MESRRTFCSTDFFFTGLNEMLRDTEFQKIIELIFSKFTDSQSPKFLYYVYAKLKIFHSYFNITSSKNFILHPVKRLIHQYKYFLPS